MSNGGEVVVNVRGVDVGLARLLTALEARMRQTDAAGLRLSQTTGSTLATNQQKAANSALGLAQAQARLAVAEGDSARAAGILNSALASNAGASERATLAVQTSAARLQNSTGFAQQFGASMKSSLLGIVGPAAAAGAALGLLSAAVGQAEAGFKLQATLDASRASITALLRGVRDSSAVFAEGAAFAAKYGLTQAELNDTLQSSVGVMRASNASTTDLLETLSRLQVLAPEKPISEAARALRELQSGDTTSIKELFNIAAKDANKMKAEIQGGADAVATVAKFLDGAGVGMDALAIKTQGAAGKMRELAKANEDFQLALSGGAGGIGLDLLNARIAVTGDATKVLKGDVTGAFDAIKDSGLGTLNPLIGGLNAYNIAVIGAGRSALEWAGIMQAAATPAQGMTTALAATNAAIAASIPATLQSGQATAALSDFQNTATRSSTLLAQGLEFASAKEQVAAVDAQTAAFAHDQLNAAAQTAANALLGAGNQGAASAAQLAGSSSLIDQLTAAFYRLAAAKQAAGLADAIARGRSVDSSDTSDLRRARLESFTRAQTANRASTEAATQAELRHQQALGNYAPSVARARAELAQLHQGTAAFADKETEIVRLSQAAQSGARKAGGAAKLSDQTKLNNSLLANQEAADNKAEDAEAEHQKKLLDIEADFAAKSLAQQRTNEVAKRQSKFSFYKSLADVEKNLGKDGARIAQEASAAYEAAFQESQKLAQAGQQKLAADRLALRQRQIQEDVQAASDIAKAKQDKDKAAVASLLALEALRKDAQAEELKQLEASGDADVNAKTKALSDEQARFEEQQGKIGTAAERAAQRKITAAQQSGKAIADENTLLATQEATLNRIGTRAPTAPGATPPPSVAPGGAGSATGVDLGALAGKLDAIVSAVSAAKDSIVGAQRDTTRAVGSLSGRLVN